MKTDYHFDDREIGSFYNSIATKRIDRMERGGGFRIVESAHFKDVEKMGKTLDILLYYENKFKEAGKWKYYSAVRRARSRVYNQVFNWNKDYLGELTIPDEKRGEALVKGKLSRTVRVMVNAFESILNDKPNQMAKAIFNYSF